MAIIKTQVRTELLAITDVAKNTVLFSSELDLADVDEVCIQMYFAPNEAAVTPTKGTRFAIQASPATTGDEEWATLTSFVTERVAGTKYDADAIEPIGETVIAESATAGLVVGDLVFFDTPAGGTIADSQWREVVALSANTSFTLSKGLKMATAVGDDIWRNAEKFSAVIGAACSRIRVLVDNNYQAGTAMNITVQIISLTTKWR